MAVEKLFFQSSLPRSGSTIYQSLMGQNPDFYVTPTSGVFELVFGARANFTNSPEFKAQDSELMKKGFINFCNKGMMGFFDAVTDKKYVLDKSRAYYKYRPFLETIYPDPKIITLIRDPRDIFASYEKIYRKNQSLYNDPINDDLTARGTTVYKRMDEWANPQNTIGRGLERLQEVLKQGYDNKILFIKYEDLCLRPEAEMVRVYQYLDLPYFEHDFDNIEQITQEDDDVYGLGDGLHKIRPKLQMKPSDARAVLGKDICDWVYTTYQWFFERFRYTK